MRTMCTGLLTALSAFTLALASDAGHIGAGIGYRGDGSGVFAGPPPPTSCDDRSGSSIRWKVALPNWGHGSPIVVQNKVLLTCEGGWGGHDFPVLLCLDAASGKTLWQVALDHLPLTPDPSGAAKAWSAFLAEYRTHYALFDRWNSGDKEGAVKSWTEMGAIFGSYKQGYGQLRSLKRAAEQNKAIGRVESALFKPSGLAGETWQHGCGMGTSAFGQSFPTPVSDGEAVYVATAFGGMFRIALTGKIEWMRFYLGEQGEYCRNGRSPLLYGDLFISDVQGLVRAMDKKTGALRWSAPVATGTWQSPVVTTIGSTDVLLCHNKKAFRLPDGKPLTIEGGCDFGATAVVKRDERDVVFFTGGGEHGGWAEKGGGLVPPPAAVRWTLAGDTLKGTVLWSGIEGKGSNSHTGLLYYEGRLYHRGLILDPHNGKTLGKAAIETHHLTLAAGGRIVGVKEGKGGKGADCAQSGWYRVYDLAGKLLGESELHNASESPEKTKQVIEQTGFKRWRFSYACPFTLADGRAYIRSYDYLWCIGAK